MRLSNMKLPLFAAAISVAAFIAPAHATLIVGNANVSQGDNVLSNACTAEIQGPANPVEGCLNNDHDRVVRIESNENIGYSGGQAVVTPATGLGLNYLKISVPGYYFSYIEFNIDAELDGSVSFLSDLGAFSGSFALDNNGQNKFSLYGDAGEMFQWISFAASDVQFEINPPGPNNTYYVTDGNIVDVKQIRLTIGDEIEVPCTENCEPCPDCNPTEVPEPGTMALFGTALAGLAVMRRRRKSL